MNHSAPALAAAFLAAAAIADYAPPAQALSHSLTAAQAAVAISSAPDSAVVSAPAWLLRGTGAATNSLSAALAAVMSDRIADTRANIPESAALSDAQIAALYLSQMTRDASDLMSAAPTTTIEYLIGAGIRLDISASTNSTPND